MNAPASHDTGGTASRILVTGAGGFVGTWLVAALAARQPAALLFGAGLGGGEPLDLRDAAAVDAFVERARPDAIVHLAGQASVGALGQGAEEQTWRVNLAGTLNLALSVTRFVPQATLLFASSSEIYGRAFGSAPVDEDTAPQPVNAYARSKLVAERMLAEVLPQSARLIVARPFNHTGPGQREDFVLPSFAAQVARIEAGRQATMAVGNLDAARDFLDVRDVVEAYGLLLEAAPRLPQRFTCNIATGTAQALRDVVNTLRRLARVPIPVEIDPARLRPSDIAWAAGRADRLMAATGWAPRVPFEDTLRGLLDDARRRVGETP